MVSHEVTVARHGRSHLMIPEPWTLMQMSSQVPPFGLGSASLHPRLRQWAQVVSQVAFGSGLSLTRMPGGKYF